MNTEIKIDMRKTLEEIIEQEIKLYPLEYQIERALAEIDLNALVSHAIDEVINYEIDFKEMVIDAVQVKVVSMIDERELEDKIREKVDEYIDD